MAVTQKTRNVHNPAKRRLSPKQIAAGFGGSRRKAAAKSAKKRHRPASKPKAKAKSNTSRPKRKVARHRPATKPNLGKIISFSLPKESNTVATTKKNRPKRKAHSKARRSNGMKKNSGRRRSVRRNPSLGDLSGMVTSAVFTIAGAVGTKYITQMVLTTSNTGVIGYLGNLVSAFLLSWGVKSFMKNERAAGAVLAGGIVQVVLRLIADYTPFGEYTKNLGMGDYLTQFYYTPQHLARSQNWPHSALLTMDATTGGNGMGSCNSLYGNNDQYSAA